MLGGNSNRGGAGGMLGSLLGGAGGSAAQQGGLGAILGSLAGGAMGGNTQNSNSAMSNQGGDSIADLLGSVMGGQTQPEQIQATDEMNQQAEVLLKAMLYAAKCDGQIDQTEQDRIVSQLGEISDEEAEFVRREMSSPMDLEGFVRSVPRGMEQQVYFMSLTAIDLDSKEEAQYLHQLAQALNISQQASNAIHDQVGAPKLYS